jgi:hypothetical protein
MHTHTHTHMHTYGREKRMLTGQKTVEIKEHRYSPLLFGSRSICVRPERKKNIGAVTGRMRSAKYHRHHHHHHLHDYVRSFSILLLISLSIVILVVARKSAPSPETQSAPHRYRGGRSTNEEEKCLTNKFHHCHMNPHGCCYAEESSYSTLSRLCCHSQGGSNDTERFAARYVRRSYSPMVLLYSASTDLTPCAIIKLSCRLRSDSPETLVLHDKGKGSRRLPIYDTAFHEMFAHIIMNHSALAQSVLIPGSGVHLGEYLSMLRWLDGSEEDIPETCVWNARSIGGYAMSFVGNLSEGSIHMRSSSNAKSRAPRLDRANALAAALMVIGDVLTGKMDRYDYNTFWAPSASIATSRCGSVAPEGGEVALRLVPLDFEGWTYDVCSFGWEPTLAEALKVHPFIVDIHRGRRESAHCKRSPGMAAQREILRAVIDLAGDLCGERKPAASGLVICHALFRHVIQGLQSDALFRKVWRAETDFVSRIASANSSSAEAKGAGWWLKCCRSGTGKKSLEQTCESCYADGESFQFNIVQHVIVRKNAVECPSARGSASAAEFLGRVAALRLDVVVRTAQWLWDTHCA